MSIITIAYMPIMLLAKIWILDDLTCIVYSGIMTYLVEVQGCINAIGSFDRMLATIKPNNFVFRKSLKFQISIIVGCCLLVFAVLTIPAFLISTKEISKNNKTIVACDPYDKNTWILMYFKVQYALLRAILPFLTMIVSNSLIIWKAIQMKNTTGTTDRKPEISVFKALILLDLFFIVFRIPIMLYLLFAKSFEVFLEIGYSICLSISLINNVLMFVILIFTSKLYRKLFFQYMKFRIEFRLLLNQNRIEPALPSVAYSIRPTAPVLCHLKLR
jgi:hypothetical protein